MKVVCVVAYHASCIGQHIRRKGVLVGDDPHGFEIVGSLQLSRGLLQLLVGNLITGKLVADAEADAIFRR